jgi:2-isopropylmalate synthase
MSMPFRKYKPYPHVELADRTWPDTRITRAPIWTSVDLRDGNQALDPPMDGKRKRRMFELLLSVGFKEIEVGFPAASELEFDFMRMLARQDLIPDDVTAMVLTQARRELIERTFESLNGLPRAIVHLYNSTSETQRRVVFGLDRAGVRDIAVNGAKWCRELAEQRPDQDIRFEYSPESFSATEPEYALEVCEAVMDVFEPTPERKLILNLPATVELSTPNLHADVIEWFGRNISRRDSVIISLHPHNDRGAAVAATELALMAGADRVEGTLFGNGERTGNVDIVTLALNMMAQGVDPVLDFSNLEGVRKEAEYCNRLPVHERHPYAGELVFTAFSGSHQDAINKGIQAMDLADETATWDVPYLPIDPRDIGARYDDAVRVNSQSGKGGVAYLMRAENELILPRLLQIEFTRMVQREVEKTGAEITAQRLNQMFRAEYLNLAEATLITHEVSSDDSQHVSVLRARLRYRDRAVISIDGTGSGTLAAFIDALERVLGTSIRVRDYSQQTLSDGTDARAMSYVKLTIGNETAWGIGEDTDTAKANFDAILSAVSRIPNAWDRLVVDEDEAHLTPLKVEFAKALEELDRSQTHTILMLGDYRIETHNDETQVTATIRSGSASEVSISGAGHGTIEAFVDAVEKHYDVAVAVLDYTQATLRKGTDAVATSRMELSVGNSTVHGVADNEDTVRANFQAILNGVARGMQIESTAARGQRVEPSAIV